MSAFSKKDMELLQEAYKVTLLKEEAPNMTISQLESRIGLMNESELQYINTVMDRILNEFWGGSSNIASSIGKGLSNVKDKFSNVVSAGKSGLSQIGSNVGDIYKKGEIKSRQIKGSKEAYQAVKTIYNFLVQAEKDGLLKGYDRQFSDMTMSEIIDYLIGIRQAAKTNAKKSSERGIGYNVGQAIKSGYQNK